MKIIELNTIDKLIFLVERLKAITYLELLLAEEYNRESYDGFSGAKASADRYLLEQGAETVVKLMDLVSDDDFTKTI